MAVVVSMWRHYRVRMRRFVNMRVIVIVRVPMVVGMFVVVRVPSHYRMRMHRFVNMRVIVIVRVPHRTKPLIQHPTPDRHNR